MLHKSGLPVLLAANKIDSPELEFHIHDFAKFGFPVFQVSALNNRGFDDLTGKLYGILPPGTHDDIPRLCVAIVGRPNVGKSTLLNALLSEQRAIVTDIPGTTRDTVEEIAVIGGVPVRLIDTAGMRAPRDPVEAEGVRRSQEAMKRADLLLLLLDRSCQMTAEDRNLLQRKWDRPVFVVLNKSDLAAVIKADTIESQAAEYQLYEISAETKDGIEQLIEGDHRSPPGRRN